jgi:tetratricopeptide (TPR) repeat protein
MVLAELGRSDDALALCRAAERSRPDPATPYLRAAQVFVYLGRLEAALPYFQSAARLAPNDRNVRYHLGMIYDRLADYPHAIVELEAALNLPPVTYERTVAELDVMLANECRTLLEQCRGFAALEARLPGVLDGKESVSPQVRCDLAGLCIRRRQWIEATHLFAQAFAEEPRLAEPVNSARYNAACAAALAAADPAAEGFDAERVKLRGQALAWLRAELAALRLRWDSGSPADRAEVQKLMQHWHADSDLVGVRDPSARMSFSAEERASWASLWDEAARLLKRAGTD